MPCRHPRKQCDFFFLPIFANFQELSFTLTKFGVALGDFWLLFFKLPLPVARRLTMALGINPAKSE
jgi:hypothetical protein